jgi:hypothetical protein
MVDYRITADERAWFKRCRRQWDFASPHRRNLRSSGFVEPALPAALKDALAVYYYPGTWDWQHEVTQPLVHKALARSLADAGASGLLAQGAAVLDCYDAWANAVDDFAPVKINIDVEALVPDPDDPERGLLVHDGSPVIYLCQIDLVAVDVADEYWVVCHQIVDQGRTSIGCSATRRRWRPVGHSSMTTSAWRSPEPSTTSCVSAARSSSLPLGRRWNACRRPLPNMSPAAAVDHSRSTSESPLGDHDTTLRTAPNSARRVCCAAPGSAEAVTRSPPSAC